MHNTAVIYADKTSQMYHLLCKLYVTLLGRQIFVMRYTNIIPRDALLYSDFANTIVEFTCPIYIY